MYLALILIIVALLFAVVGIFSGGIFTIVLVPLAVIGAGWAIMTLAAARAAGVEGTKTGHPAQPIGRAGTDPNAPGEIPVTPDEYVTARQRSQ